MRTVASQGPYDAARSTDAYLVLGASGEYTIGPGTSVFASVRNLTDRGYVASRHPSGVRPGLPRLFLAGLKLEFAR
jgi:outer membrane receptor protein involved in Fe transport